MENNSNKGTPAVSVKSLQKRLKEVVAQELELLPDILADMPPVERIKAVLQLLPYTTPKVEAGMNDTTDWD